jgi:hypothetical protein
MLKRNLIILLGATVMAIGAAGGANAGASTGTWQNCRPYCGDGQYDGRDGRYQGRDGYGGPDGRYSYQNRYYRRGHRDGRGGPDGLYGGRDGLYQGRDGLYDGRHQPRRRYYYEAY